MNELLATQIQQEIGRAKVQIGILQRYVESLEEALNLGKQAPVLPQTLSTRITPIREIEPTQPVDLGEADLYQPQPVTGQRNVSATSTNLPNTLEMTRVVLKNAGGDEKTVDELREMIRRTYGIEPAKSLDQMLYKRSAAGRGFYKTAEGKYGLSELRKGVTIDEVAVPSTTVV